MFIPKRMSTRTSFVFFSWGIINVFFFSYFLISLSANANETPIPEAVSSDIVETNEPSPPQSNSWIWFQKLSSFLQWSLEQLHAITHHWPLALGLLAVLIQLILLPLSLAINRHQIQMNQLTITMQPELTVLKEKYKDDAEERDEAIWALQKQYGLTPLTHIKGLLPLAIQLPILTALFSVILGMESMEGSPFLWINNLTKPDALFSWGMQLPWLGSSLNLLPFVLFIEQSLIVYFIKKNDYTWSSFFFPLLIALMFYPFPSAVLIYFIAGTCIQVVQAYIQSQKKEFPNE